MKTKTRTDALGPCTPQVRRAFLAFALRLSITADSKERSQQALNIAKQLATGMTANQVASAKQMAAIT